MLLAVRVDHYCINIVTELRRYLYAYAIYIFRQSQATTLRGGTSHTVSTNLISRCTASFVRIRRYAVNLRLLSFNVFDEIGIACVRQTLMWVRIAKNRFIHRTFCKALGWIIDKLYHFISFIAEQFTSGAKKTLSVTSKTTAIDFT